MLCSENLTFPKISEEAIHSKIEKIVVSYDESTKHGDYRTLSEVFDIIKSYDEWLTAEYKDLHRLQLGSKEQVGYPPGKPADI